MESLVKPPVRSVWKIIALTLGFDLINPNKVTPVEDVIGGNDKTR
jgi:hypothetical protein